MNKINDKNYKVLTPFKGWVLENFPFIEADFDAITNYELYCKIVEYLNNVIYNQNQVQDLGSELVAGYNDVVDYVNNYFDNLDVQTEINEKLDQLVDDGTLTQLISNYIQPLIEAQNQEIENIEQMVRNTVGVTPYPVSSTSEMVDQSKIYVNTTDGYWYYYNGSAWTQGGLYQSTGINPNSITSGILATSIQNNICNYSAGIVTAVPTPNKFCSVNASANTYALSDTSSSAGYVLYTVPVIAGEKYYIKSNLPANLYQVVFVNSTNSTLIGYSEITTSTDTFEITINVPSGSNTMYVNTRTGRPVRIQKLDVSKVNTYIDKTDNIENIIYKETKENITENITKHSGAFYNPNTDNVNNWASGSYYETTCQYGDIFYITTSLVGNMTSYILKDTNGLTVETGTIETGSIIYTDKKIKVNNVNATTIYFDCLNSYNFKCEKVTSQTLDVITPNDLESYKDQNNFEIENLQRRCTNLEDNNEFRWKPFDKSYFAFVIDDCNSFTPTCADLFHTLNKPLGCAVITSTLNTVYDTASGRSIKQILDSVVSDGGEVLAHYTGNLAPAGTPSTSQVTYLTSYDDWKLRTRDVKYTLTKLGYNVRGLIRADQTIANTETGQEWCEKYFDYSDNMGISGNYNLGTRKFFIGVNSLDNMKTWIDNACNTPGFYPLCLHGNRVDEPLATVENLTAIINYINSKGSIAEITTYSNVYNNFGYFKNKN